MKAILEMEDAHQLITFQNATMMVEIVVQPQVAHQQAHLQAAQDQVHHQVTDGSGTRQGFKVEYHPHSKYFSTS